MSNVTHFAPREYQRLIADHILRHKRSLIWAGMGMGKTSSTLFALDVFKRCGAADVFPVLVLAPLRVAASTWPDEVAKWRGDFDLTISAVVGTPKARKAALAAKADIYATNYENLPWLVEHFGAAWPFQMIVADESTKLKGFRLGSGGVRAKALSKVAFRYASRFVGLSGTPAPNGMEDLWGQCWFIDQGASLGRTFTAFHQRWFYSVQVAADPHAVKWQAKRGAGQEIVEAVRGYTLSVKPEDYFDISEPIFNPISITLPAAAMAKYETLRREMVMELENGGEITAANAAALTVKCLQCAAGAVYTDDAGSWEEVHKAKIKALESVIEEAAGAPVLVAYHFKSDLERLRRAFPQGRVLDKNPETLRAWNAGKIPLLFIHPASAGHGLNLQDGGNILCFFSLWWNLEQYQQVIERIGPVRQLQAGHPRPVFIHFLIAKDTLDELVLERLRTKADIQTILLKAVKARTTK